MKKPFRLFVLALAIAIQTAAAAPAVVLIVRHAEKEALPADDPALTPAGRERVAELVRVVHAWSAAGTPVRALVSSEVKRTHQTLEPLAASIGLAITVVGAKDTAAIVKTILAVDGGIVVLAGHSNTIPGIIQALGGPSGIVIADAEYDQLYALTAPGANGALVTLRYGR